MISNNLEPNLSTLRDQLQYQNINDFLAQNPNKKMILFGGAGHSDRKGNYNLEVKFQDQTYKFKIANERLAYLLNQDKKILTVNLSGVCYENNPPLEQLKDSYDFLVYPKPEPEVFNHSHRVEIK